MRRHEKVFDSVLVVSDRKVLDAQLQDAVFDFERTTGVVATIKGESASKSGELAEALAGGKKIVVCTIQTFPFALKAVQELAATQGKRFAVIADEAHQLADRRGGGQAESGAVAGGAAGFGRRGRGQHGRLVGSADGGAGQQNKGITYVAFTATPKAKTLELFGTPAQPSAAGERRPMCPRRSTFIPCGRQSKKGSSSMCCRNYTPYKLAFKLAHNGKELDEKEVERSEA